MLLTFKTDQQVYFVYKIVNCFRDQAKAKKGIVRKRTKAWSLEGFFQPLKRLSEDPKLLPCHDFDKESSFLFLPDVGGPEVWIKHASWSKGGCFLTTINFIVVFVLQKIESEAYCHQIRGELHHGRPQTFFQGRAKFSRGGQKHTICLKNT